MSKIFLYIDETKQLQNGIIILGGFVSKYNKSSCNQVIEESLFQYGLNKHKELKSTSKYGKELISKGGMEFLQEKGVIESIVGTISYDYYRDSYEGYRACLMQLIAELDIHDDIIAIYIDTLPIIKNTKILQKYLERDICPIFSNIAKIIPENSSNQRCIQMADLIIGEIRKYYLYRECVPIASIFPTIPKKVTMKNLLVVTSSSVLLAQAP